MTRKTLHRYPRTNLGHGFQADVIRERLQTPDLGPWEIFAWTVFENGHCIKTGSFPEGDQYICLPDVIGQLQYEFIDKPGYESVCDSAMDPAFGL